jgi:uncharacterized protein YsxB (DUF464 family)
MIKIDIVRNKLNYIEGFCVIGHADTAPHGQDIVCAGVSALTQTAVIGLERYLGRQVDLDIASGKLVATLKGAPDHLTAAILETMVLGLQEVAKLNPANVRIVECRR